MKPADGYRAAKDQHLRSFAALSPLERLRWLHQAKQFCRKYLGAARGTSEAEMRGYDVSTDRIKR